MLNRFFHFIQDFMVALYRLTHGRFGGRVQGLQVLLLTTTGRKSGEERTTPLGYFIDNGNYIISATNAGQDKQPAWFHNLLANPGVKIEVQDQHMQAQAEVVASEKRNSLWSKLISLSPGYAIYANRTSREIPMVILHPLKIV